MYDYITWFNGYKKFEVEKKSIQKQSSHGKVTDALLPIFQISKSKK